MKLAIAYSTKDEVENTEQTFPTLYNAATEMEFDLFWCDASVNKQGLELPFKFGISADWVTGGADAAIAWKLSTMLASPENYTHIGLLENDVLLDEDWFEPTMALFEKGKADGLEVGAVSARSYVDRVLVQRDGFAVMHNLGAGVVIFTRDAAEIVLRTFRTGWWPDNVRLFAQLSGIDLRTYAAFRGNDQWCTSDWTWDAQLTANGLASLALTPAKCRMIGQKIPLEQQGLELVSKLHCDTKYSGFRRDEPAFEHYCQRLHSIRNGTWKSAWNGMIHQSNGSHLFFPHQLGAINAQWQGNLELVWSQGFGPFAYRAGPEGASLSALISGSCGFLVGGDLNGAQVTIEDTRSGFLASPKLPPVDQVTVSVPGGPIPRHVTMRMDEGAVFYGLHTTDAQMIDTSFRFDWSQLPEAK
jgi:hypothetical protein